MGDNSMPLMDHLEELRRRIIICAVAILVITLAAFFLSDWLLKIILLPSGGLQLRAFNLLDGFMIKWRLALYSGVIVSFPIWSYQIYCFVSPGMYEKERRAIVPTVFGAMILFVLGAVFGYYLLWGIIRVLIQFFPIEVQFLPSADDYISFVGFFLLACGLAFQLPTVIVLLVHLRILNTDILRKQRRYSYFGLFAFAEIITPVSDPIVAPLTVMAPLIILYEISIWLAHRIEVRRAKDEAEQLLQT